MMPFYTQMGRPLKIHTPLGPDALLLIDFEGEEHLSQLFRFRLGMLTNRNASIDFAKILGQDVTIELEIEGGYTRTFDGMIRSFRQKKRDDQFRYFEAEMVPRFWVYTQKVQSRIFQQKSVPDILKAVLADLDVDYQLSGNYLAHNFRVQYRESDFAFVSRLMEEVGIFYYFQHEKDKHHLVICDDASRLPDVPYDKLLLFEEVEGGSRSDARVLSWEREQQIYSGDYTLRDYHFEMPTQNLEATAQLPSQVTSGTVQHNLLAGTDGLEDYDFPGGYAKYFDGIAPGGGDQSGQLSNLFEANQTTVTLRREAAAAASLRIEGTGTVSHMFPGHKFTLARHFDADGEYYIVGVRHRARLRSGYLSSADEEALEYENQFEVRPADLAYRPARVTPRPRIAGPQTAKVVGPEGSQIFLDKYGRIKVQFPWDRQGKADGDSSCWIRVGQVWAGNTWGAFFWPRVGHEVVIAFEEGDPDRPIVVGSVYNAVNMPPFALPDEAMLGGFKSCSFRGDPSQTFNALIFHDVPGQEYIHMHSETYQIQNTESNRYQYTPRSQYQFLGSLPSL